VDLTNSAARLKATSLTSPVEENPQGHPVSAGSAAVAELRVASVEAVL